MRHRIKAGMIGSFTPEEQKVEQEQLEDREVIEDVEEIFEEDMQMPMAAEEIDNEIRTE